MSEYVRKRVEGLGLSLENMDYARPKNVPPEDYLVPCSSVQGIELVGPTGVLWLVNRNLQASSEALQDAQRYASIELCRQGLADPELKNYGHHLAIVQREVHRGKALCSIDFAIENPCNVAPGSWLHKIEEHQKFLQYLGDIQELVTRCREAEFMLSGNLRDLRDCEPLKLKKDLYKLGVPGTNYINVYRHNFRQTGHMSRDLIDLWLSQDDEQIASLHKEFGVFS